VLKVPNAALRVRIAGVEPAPPAAQASTPQAEASAPATSAAAPATGPGAGGAATEFRNRLVAELKLDAAQTEKVDAIYASTRPKFMQLRDLPEAERAKARERLTADIRARISELLTPEQKPRYATMVAEAASRTSARGRIYLLGEDGKPKAFNARLGITDGTSTELIVPANSPDAAELKEGASVITGTVTPGAPATPARPATTGPRMMF
jgi:HlyD family secretion protein